MNSAEQMDYKHVAPSDEEIQHTISFIRKKLDEPGIDSAEIKSGYEAAVNILENQTRDPDQLPSHLVADKSKAIAILAINYLNGECSREVLLGFGFSK